LVHSDKALEFFQSTEDPYLLQSIAVTRSIAHQHFGEYGEAQNYLLQALSVIDAQQGISRLNHEAYLLLSLGEINYEQGNLAGAGEYCQLSLKVGKSIPDYTLIAADLGLAARIGVKQGQWARAARLAGASEAMFGRQKRKVGKDSALDTILPGWHNGPDRVSIGEAHASGQSMSSDEVVAYALDGQPA
jgi:tetratricopeptide (TPR) repeat protein